MMFAPTPSCCLLPCIEDRFRHEKHRTLRWKECRSCGCVVDNIMVAWPLPPDEVATHDADPCLCDFSPDEREVLLTIAERIRKARPTYGPLNIDTDTRDWDDEAQCEDLDSVVYRTISHIKRVRARVR